MKPLSPETPSRRFLFDTVFDGDKVIPAPRPKRAFTPEELEAARAEAFAAGERSAAARAEAEAAQALSHVARLAAEAMAGLTAVVHEHRTAAARLALASARKIADAALDAFPDKPAEAALAALALELEAAPRLIVHTGASDLARLQAALAQAAEQAGFAGQIALKGDPRQSRAAFVLDWGDGKAAFDPETSARRVAEALEAALAAEGPSAPPLSPTPSAEVRHG